MAIAVAQEKQILDNRAAAGPRPDHGRRGGKKRGCSTVIRRPGANQGVATEQAAGALAAENTVAAQTLNQRMPDLGNHVTVDSLKFTFWGTVTLPVK